MKSERGSASLEFIAAGVLLIVPLIYLTLVLGRVQAGTLAVEGVARQAARVYVTAPSAAVASARVDQAVRDGLADFNFTPSASTVTISCVPATSPCLRSQAWVTVNARVSVSLPFVPSILGLDKFARITVSSRALEQVAIGAGIG